MQNGFGLNSHLSTTNAALIVPKPLSENIYYIFTVGVYGGNQGGFGGTAYTVVDMSLDGGLGGVTHKNILLHEKSTEKLCATLHKNETDYWIMTHDFGNNQFRAFLLTQEGIAHPPVISAIGSVHKELPVGDWGSRATGSMRFSPSGCRLGLVVAGSQLDTVQVFNFDRLSGFIFDAVTLKAGCSSSNPYALCFSPDNQLLYVSGHNCIYQFDLSHEVQSTIQEQRKTIAFNTLQETGSPKYQFMDLQIAPNGKIYVARILTNYLSSIDEPNSVGDACNFVDVSITFESELLRYGLPNFVSNYLTPNLTEPSTCKEFCPPFNLEDEVTICRGDTLTITVDSPEGSLLWDNGNKGFELQVFEEGVYRANYSFFNCPTLTDSIQVSLISNNLPELQDTVACPDHTFTLELPFAAGQDLLWSNGMTGPVFETEESGLFELVIINDDCIFNDSFFIDHFCGPETAQPPLVIPNIFTPNNDGMNDFFRPFNYEGIKNMEISIYNRWGNLVYHENGPVFSWDGYQNGVKSSSGTYFYILHYTNLTNELSTIQGTITLVE